METYRISQLFKVLKEFENEFLSQENNVTLGGLETWLLQKGLSCRLISLSPLEDWDRELIISVNYKATLKLRIKPLGYLKVTRVEEAWNKKAVRHSEFVYCDSKYYEFYDSSALENAVKQFPVVPLDGGYTRKTFLHETQPIKVLSYTFTVDKDTVDKDTVDKER